MSQLKIDWYKLFTILFLFSCFVYIHFFGTYYTEYKDQILIVDSLIFGLYLTIIYQQYNNVLDAIYKFQELIAPIRQFVVCYDGNKTKLNGFLNAKDKAEMNRYFFMVQILLIEKCRQEKMWNVIDNADTFEFIDNQKYLVENCNIFRASKSIEYMNRTFYTNVMKNLKDSTNNFYIFYPHFFIFWEYNKL